MNGSNAARTTATKAKLERVARELFGARGFDGVSAEELVARAEVTRGALYHHYDGKEGLFEVVVETLMQEMHAGLARESQAQVDPLAALQQGVGAFLSVCAEPSIRQILLIDAPAVLGWQRWRELDTKYGFGLLKRAFSAAMATGLMRPGDVDVFAHLLLGAIIEAAMLIARSPHPAKARKAAERTLVGLIEGCRIRQGGTSESPPQA